jgi:hypothetical protein
VQHSTCTYQNTSKFHDDKDSTARHSAGNRSPLQGICHAASLLLVHLEEWHKLHCCNSQHLLQLLLGVNGTMLHQHSICSLDLRDNLHCTVSASHHRLRTNDDAILEQSASDGNTRASIAIWELTDDQDVCTSPSFLFSNLVALLMCPILRTERCLLQSC